MDTASIVLLICAIFMFLAVVCLPLLGIIWIVRLITNQGKRAYRSIRR